MWNVYVGQTGRSFATQYAKHVHNIRHNKDKSKYAKRILYYQHEYGTKYETTEILKVINEGNLMDKYKKYYIHKYSKMEVSLNEHVISPNVQPTNQKANSPVQAQDIFPC
jgi:hypothetical protein